MAKVSVSVSDDHMDRFAEVVEQARAAGLEVYQEMDSIGILNGSIDDERVEELRGVPGVAAVEAERSFEIGPPNSDVQALPMELPEEDTGSGSSTDY